MAGFEIFADSSANLPETIQQNRNIHIISYYMNINGNEVLCQDDSLSFRETARKFYAEMRAGMEAKTSLVGEERFIEAISPTLAAGKDAVILTIASGISGTWFQAINAKKTLEAQFPDRKVFVCDSANASMGQGLLAIRAADIRDAGESAETCAAWLNENAYRLNSYVTVDDLKYLRKSGRVSALAAFAGSLLNIKPLIKADGGEHPKLTVYGKAHGRKKAIAALVEAFDANVEHPETQTVAITHADCEAEALALAETIKQRGVQDVIVEFYDLCTGSHIGPGTIALFFFGKDRREEAKQKAPSLIQRVKAATHKA